MRWLSRLQATGSLLVLGAFALAELSAHLLERFPGSAFAWYLCVGLFRPFETGRSGTSALRFLYGPQSLAVACGLILLTLFAYFAERRWCLAAIANVSFVSTGFLAYGWFARPGFVQGASLGGGAWDLPADSLIVGAMLIASLGAALLGHAVLLGWSGPRQIRPRSSV